MPNSRKTSAIVLALCFGCGGAPAPRPPPGNAAPSTASTPRRAWSTACRNRLAAAAAGFRRRAPSLYPPYAMLNWRDDPGSQDRDDSAVLIRISPGRTWSFVAAAETDAAIAGAGMVLDKPAATPTWTQIPNTELALSRRSGDLSLVIFVSTERSAVAPLAAHPLVIAFVEQMERVLDQCGAAS